MPGLSIHVVDVSRGIVAHGMRVVVEALDDDGHCSAVLADGRVGPGGHLSSAALDARLGAGRYRAQFHVADYYRTNAAALPSVPFLEVVVYDFGIAAPEQHYHLPFKCTPWGYSCFRGGA